MALPQDMEFRRGLAGCLGGIGAVLFGIALELAAPLFASVGAAAAVGFVGLLVAIAGAIYGVAGVDRMTRATRIPPR